MFCVRTTEKADYSTRFDRLPFLGNAHCLKAGGHVNATTSGTDLFSTKMLVPRARLRRMVSAFGEKKSSTWAIGTGWLPRYASSTACQSTSGFNAYASQADDFTTGTVNYWKASIVNRRDTIEGGSCWCRANLSQVMPCHL